MLAFDHQIEKMDRVGIIDVFKADAERRDVVGKEPARHQEREAAAMNVKIKLRNIAVTLQP